MFLTARRREGRKRPGKAVLKCSSPC